MRKKTVLPEVNVESQKDIDSKDHKNDAHLLKLSVEEKELVKLLALIFAKSILNSHIIDNQ